MNDACKFCVEPLEFEHTVFAETPLIYGIENIKPHNPGHKLVIPKRHIESYFDLSVEEMLEVHTMVLQARDLIQEEYNYKNFHVISNIGKLANQTVFHAHIHIVPRIEGDKPVLVSRKT